ncbi:MAG: hypothetical protein ACTSUE_23985 [Promethearchaeota archaeon]
MGEFREKVPKTSQLEKILDLMGVKDPAKQVERIISALNVGSSDLDQGAFDIQKIYTELEHSLLDLGLGKLKESFKKLLEDVIKKVNIDDFKDTLKKLQVKERVEEIDKAIEVIRLHEQVKEIKGSMEKLGIRNVTKKLKQLLEESVIQERVEDFITYLKELGIENPVKSLEDILEIVGLKKTYDEINSVLGWDEKILI